MGLPATAFHDFRTEIERRKDELTSILPKHVTLEKFMNTALIAVKNNPDLLEADRRSLHRAITQAAEDGLHADGREGAIVINNTKVKQNGKDVWIKVATWMPMIYGIRKRAIELATMVIDTQLVHANDRFIWRQGDEPLIEHEPAKLGTDRGEFVGAYAIFKIQGEILHREVMDKDQIDKVRQQSRAPTGPMWGKHFGEAARKTVLRRGVKTVPAVPALERIITRIDEEYPQFGKPKYESDNVVALQNARSSGPLIEAQAIPSAPEEEIADDGDQHGTAPSHNADHMSADGQNDDAAKRKTPPRQEAQKEAASGGGAKRTALEQFELAATSAETEEALDAVWSMFEERIPRAERDKAQQIYVERLNKVGGKK